MRGTAHERSALAEFQNGEERLVYARHKADPEGPLYFLHDGTAAEVRAWAKEHLECFMPTCDARELTTVARSTRRDGFSHRPGAGGHAKEGLFHQQAKALIARWVTEKYTGAVVAQPEQPTRSKERRADVMLTWADGQQVAIEIQYAPLTVAHWQARHESYIEQGLTCVWLLGHIPPHLREARDVALVSQGSAGVAAFGALHEAMLAANVPLFWINPIDEQIGTVWIDTDAHECEEHPCNFPGNERVFHLAPQDKRESVRQWGFFGIDPLADCDITPEGLATPTTARLRAEHTDYLTARKADYDAQAGIREARKRREAQNRHEEEVRQRVLDARTARMFAEDAKVRDFLVTEADALEAHWKNSTTHARLLAAHGAIPTVLNTDLLNDIGVRGLAVHWHSALYETHILGRPDGEKFSIGDCYRTLTGSGFALHSEGARRAGAIIGFLAHLAEAGLVYLRMSPFRPGQVDYVRVYGDFNTAAENKRLRGIAKAEREVHAAEQARKAEVRKAEIRRRRHALEQNQRERAHTINEPRDTPTVTASTSKPTPTPDVSDAPKYTKCRTCGMRLADILMERGYHFGCEPSP